MKTVEEKDILEENMEAINLLERLGCNRGKARLFIYFLNNKQGKSRDIERAMDLRQPEVSLEMRELIKNKYVTRKFLKKHGKGRPEILYTAITPNKLLAKIEEDTTRKLNEIKSDIVKLKALIKEMKN